MPLLNTVATPYAEALLQITESNKESEVIAQQCKELGSIWHSQAEFREVMNSPILEPAQKKVVLESILGDQINTSLMNLLKVLADSQRLQAFDAVLQKYLELYRHKQGITLAKVRSAQALTEPQQQLLTDKILAMAGSKKVDIELVVDSSLIGGFIVSLGSQVIDSSLAGQVRRLGLMLVKSS